MEVPEEEWWNAAARSEPESRRTATKEPALPSISPRNGEPLPGFASPLNPSLPVSLPASTRDDPRRDPWPCSRSQWRGGDGEVTPSGRAGCERIPRWLERNSRAERGRAGWPDLLSASRRPCLFRPLLPCWLVGWLVVWLRYASSFGLAAELR